MIYRNNAGRLVSGIIIVCLQTRCLGHLGGFYVHFLGVIPRMLRVRPWRGRVEGEEGDDWVFCFLLLLTLLDTGIGRLPGADAGGDDCRGHQDCIWDTCMRGQTMSQCSWVPDDSCCVCEEVLVVMCWINSELSVSKR